jgi:DNA-binding NarL/FixJ family response regulator
MVRVHLAVTRTIERSALRLLLVDLNLQIAGETADWSATTAQLPLNRSNMLVLDWDILPDPPGAAIETLRQSCPHPVVIVLLSHLDARQQVVISAGVDAFISRTDASYQVVERLRNLSASILTQ